MMTEPMTGALPATQSRLLAVVGVVHGVTGRVPGLGAADGNLGFGPPRDPLDAWNMRRAWCDRLGLDPATLVAVSQVHGSEVIRVGRGDAGRGARPGSPPLGVADALITDEPGVALLTLHADCLPILLVDPDRPAVAAVHAGWRGTVAGVASATVAAMAAAFGTDPQHVLAFLGPAIGPCCYEVGSEVVAAWRRAAGPDAPGALIPTNGSSRLDLRSANALLLQRSGLAPDRMEISDVCTRCSEDAWFSHRGQGPGTGRFGAIIALDPAG